MRPMLAAIALLLTPVALAPGALAQALCVKPGVPVCMDDTTTFVSADRMTVCQQEVREYIDRTMDYLRCLNEENAATGRELSQSVERFNCRLSGTRNCG